MYKLVVLFATILQLFYIYKNIYLKTLSPLHLWMIIIMKEDIVGIYT